MLKKFFQNESKRAKGYKNFFASPDNEIAKKNLQSMRLASVLTALYVVIAYIMSKDFAYISHSGWFSLAFFVVLFLFIIISHLYGRKFINDSAVFALCVLFYITVMAFLIYKDTVMVTETDGPSSFFPMVFILLPVIFIFRLQTVLLLNLLIEMAYLISAYSFEDGPIRNFGIYNSIFSFILSYTIACIVLVIRIDDHTVKLRYKELSRIDYLTNIYNKNTCESVVSNYLSRRSEDSICALIIMDIDDFKTANDRYGHAMGDRVLEDFSRYLCEVFGSSSILGRIGGDEFSATIMNIHEESTVAIKCKELQEKLKEINYVEGYTVCCSIGAAILKNCTCGYYQLFRLADQALYEAKTTGKNRFVLRRFNGAQETLGFVPSIALIDYDSVQRASIHNLLRRHYEVKDADNDTDAINLIDFMKERISGVILDFYSDNISSYMILKYIRQQLGTKKIPIIAIIPEGKDEGHFLKQGITKVFNRPIDETDFLNTLKKLISLNNK